MSAAAQRAGKSLARDARRRLSPDARRTELLDAAVRVLRERGPAACRVEDVTAEAGTAKGNCYRYFATRDALLIAVRDHLPDSYRDDLERRYADVSQIDWWPALDSEIDRFLEFQLRLGALHEAFFHGPAAAANPVRPQRSAALSVAWFINAGIAAGAFAAADVEITATLMFALLHAAADSHYLRDRRRASQAGHVRPDTPHAPAVAGTDRRKTSAMTYHDAMTAGQDALRDGEYDRNFDHFTAAHALGHNVRRHHLAAHAGLMRASWHGRRMVRLAAQSGLWAAAYLFDRQRAPRAPIGA